MRNQLALSCALYCFVLGVTPIGEAADGNLTPVVYPVDSYGAIVNDGLHDTAAIQAGINAADAGGGGIVRFSAGTYDVGMNALSGQVLNLAFMSDIRLEGATVGTTEILHHQQDAGFFDVTFSMRVEFHDLVLDYAPDAINFTQGTVVAAADAQGFFEIDIESGYRDPTALTPSNYNGIFYHVYLWEPVMLYQKANHWFLDCQPNIAPLGGSRWRCQLIPAHLNRAGEIEVGDRITLDGRTTGFMVFGAWGSELVFEDVTVYHTPGVSVANLLECHSSTFRRFEVVRRPGTTRILTANGDALHLDSCGDLTVDGCIFEGLGDDAIAHGALASVVTEVNATNDEIWVNGSTLGLLQSVGHTLQIFDYNNGVMRTSAAGAPEVAQVLSGPAPVWRNGTPQVNLRLQAPVPGIVGDPNAMVGVGDSLFDVDDAKGFSITNCWFDSIRGVAIRARIHDGVVSGNVVMHTNGEGCLIANDVHWGAGPIPKNVTLANNVFLDCNRRSAGKAQVWIGCRTLNSLTNFTDRAATGITLTNNYFADSPDRAIIIQSADGVHLEDMIVSHSFHSVFSSEYYGVVIDNSDDVKFDQGAVMDLDPAVAAGIWIRANSGSVTIDDSTSIVVPASAVPIRDDRSDG